MDFNFIVSSERAGLRLDQAVCSHLASCSRSRAATLIGQGLILVDGTARRTGFRVKEGQSVTGRIAPDETAAPEACSISLSILHEDDQILVIDKPAGLVVHPGPGHTRDTLVNALLAHHSAFHTPGWEDPMRPGIVHRLDQDTSGLLIVAKNPGALAFLQKEFKERRVKKTYLALVQGENIPDRGVIEKPVGRHPKKRKLMAVVDTGKYAKTAFEVHKRFENAALVAVSLFTGRTHQIRVHFYDQNMPLMGDGVYQLRRNRNRKDLAPRQMLHSWQLAFRHPHTGVAMTFCAPLPEDFNQVMSRLNPF